MPNTIRLSAPAVRAMMDTDPEFKLELQRCVIAEVLKNSLLDNYRGLANEVAPAAMEELKRTLANRDDFVEAIDAKLKGMTEYVRSQGYSYPSTKKLTAENQEAVNKAVDEIIRSQVAAAQAKAQKMINDQVDQIVSSVEAKLPRTIEAMINVQVNDRIKAGVQKRLDEIAAKVNA